MKKIISITLIAALFLSLTGCSLFSDNSIVNFDDIYTHKDPADLTYDERIALKGDNFEEDLEEYVNADAYPDTMVYDEKGNIIGMYDYDATTGLAAGWTRLSDGDYTAFKKGAEKNLGMPDTSKMIDISGTVTVACVVYGNEGNAVANYLYLFLSDASAKETVKTSMENLFSVELTEENDTVLKSVQDSAFIENEFKNMEDSGSTVTSKDASAYAEILKQYYGVKTYGGANPFKPYDGHQDPEDLDFDQRVVLTGSAQYAVLEEYIENITSMTDYVYGKDGEVIARYTYYEFPSKADADKVLAEDAVMSYRAERISDTVVLSKIVGKDMEEHLISYMGYNVLTDKKVDTYVEMLEETYFTSIYE